jgi:hypothetical protein
MQHAADETTVDQMAGSRHRTVERPGAEPDADRGLADAAQRDGEILIRRLATWDERSDQEPAAQPDEAATASTR